MFNHLIYQVLLHTKPRNYLEIKKCSNSLNYKLKEYQRQFIKGYSEIKEHNNNDIVYRTVHYYYTLNNRKIINCKFKEIIIVTDFKLNKIIGINIIKRLKNCFKCTQLYIILGSTYILWNREQYKFRKLEYLYNNLYHKTKDNENKLRENTISFNFSKSNRKRFESLFDLSLISDITEQKNKNYPFLINLKKQKIIKNY